MHQESPRRSGTERPRELPQTEDHKKVERVDTIQFAHEVMKNSPQVQGVEMRDFSTLYDVARDEKKVATFKQRFAQDLDRMRPAERQASIEAKMMADVFEGLVYSGIKEKWFGDKVIAVRTAPFDDILNGVDLVIEIGNAAGGKQHVALAIDVSFGVKSVPNKFRGILEKIDENKPTEVKYFQTKGFKGMLTNVPRTVVGVERDAVEKLAGLWLSTEADAASRKQFQEHAIQLLILEQIVAQLEVFADYANRDNAGDGEREEYVTMCDQTLELLRPILEKKQETLSIAEFKHDRVHKEIVEGIEATRDATK